MPLTDRLQRHWRPLAASALALVLGLTVAALHGYSSLQSQRVQLDEFGQALARSAAQRAVDATLSQDMISLQVVLQELTRHPRVVGATIHDVENRLLVQSGFAPADARSGQFRHYSASVALDDNIAGHLQLAMTPVSLSVWDRQFFILWGLLIVIAAALPWAPQVRAALQPPRASAPHYPSPDPEEGPEPAAPDEPSARLRLRLQLANLTQLYRQLNRESFNRQVTRFEKQLHGVLSLYSGQRLALSRDTLLIDFVGENHSDCAFRALCSAQLLGEMSHLNSGPRLRLNARIHPLPDTPGASLAEDFNRQYLEPREADTLGIEIAPDLIDEVLQQHLELDPETGVLVGVKSPYRQLLDKQQQQLQSLSERE